VPFARSGRTGVTVGTTTFVTTSVANTSLKYARSPGADRSLPDPELEGRGMGAEVVTVIVGLLEV
jgi:hypothetical protein